MLPGQRPNRRDWIAAILTGAVLGLAFLGVGARIGMRVVALQSGQPGAFTPEGSIAVTPLHFDLTDQAGIASLEGFDLDSLLRPAAREV